MSARAEHFGSRQNQREAAELGIWVFLATELMFFGPLFLAYAAARLSYPDGFAAASRHTDLVIGTINTAVLLTSSLFMALGARSAQLGRRRTASLFLYVTALLGAVFLLLKAGEYFKEGQEHLVPWLDFRFEPGLAHAASLFYLLYFAMTGLHAIHLTIGIVMVSVFARRLRSHSPASMRNQIEVGGLYWHFVDAIWVFLYPLLYLVERYS
jgi:cytochrome c oxidase subunit 3